MHTDFPRTITGARIYLQAISLQDAEEQVHAVNQSLPQLKIWLPWAQSPQTLSSATAEISSVIKDCTNTQQYCFVIRSAQTDAYMGRINLFNLTHSGQTSSAEIGYWLSTPYTGHGFMSEAVEILAQAAFTYGFNELIISCHKDNHASAAVALACSFTQTASEPEKPKYKRFIRPSDA